MKDSLHLLKTRRFLPYFCVQFLGAFNDNVFKTALAVLIVFQLGQDSEDAGMLVTAAAGIFILPFFLLSATAGQLADKYEKSRYIRLIKLLEIVLMALASLGFYLESIPLLMTTLFLMGAQSAFFGPVKYAILPERLAEDELLSGNGLVEAATFLAILTGTILGGLMQDALTVSLVILTVAALGYLAARNIEQGTPADAMLAVDWLVPRATWQVTRYGFEDKRLGLIILGISWFWFVGATFLSQFPAFVKDTLGGDQHVVTLFLAMFSLGIAIGSLLCNRLLKGEISAGYAPLAALGMSLFMGDLYLASHVYPAPAGTLQDVSSFLAGWSGWRILLDLLGSAICGGVFIVPLYSLLQQESAPDARSRIIAGLNIINALFMVASSLIVLALLGVGVNIPQIFLLTGIANLLAAWVTRRLIRKHASK